jgi:hypothetical protein
MRRAPWLAGMIAVLWLGGCEEAADTALAACDREGCSDACLDLAGSTCDVREDRCQERILSAVECVRGSQGTLPVIRVITEEEYRAEELDDAGALDASAEHADAGVGVDAGVEPPSDDVYRRALALLGLYAAQPTTDSLDYVGGYYESASRSITLIDRGEAQDSESSQVTTAHELVHALQDQELGLREFWRNAGDTTDANLARGCLIEGEATLYEELAWVLLQGLSVDVDYWDIALEWRLKRARDRVGVNDSAYDQLWLMRYAVGARFLRDAWLAGGNDAVRRIYNAPPATTLYWMLGYEASTTATAPLTRPLACPTAEPPKGFSAVWFDTLGAFTLYAFLSQNLSDEGPRPNSRAWLLAQAWRQDTLTVFESEAAALALSWRIRLADEASAMEIEDHLKQFGGGLHVDRHADELEIRATDGPAGLFKTWRGTSPSACPRE